MNEPFYFLRTSDRIYVWVEHYPSDGSAYGAVAWLRRQSELPVKLVDERLRVSFGTADEVLIPCS